MEWETIVGYGVGALILFGLYRLGIRPRGALWIARDSYKEAKRQKKETEEYGRPLTDSERIQAGIAEYRAKQLRKQTGD